MKKLFSIGLISFVLLPFFAYAGGYFDGPDWSWTGNPSPLVFRIYADEKSGLDAITGGSSEYNYWGLALIEQETWGSQGTQTLLFDGDNCVASSTLDQTFSFPLADGTNIVSVEAIRGTTLENCSYAQYHHQMAYGPFSIRGTTISTSTSPSLLGLISSAFNDDGLLLVIALAAGLPLAFWAIKRVIGLVPKGR